MWTAEESKESSNYKELGNLVESTKEEATAWHLRNCECFLSTGNSTVKSCYYRGSFKSSRLHALALQLCVLEMKYGLIMCHTYLGQANDCPGYIWLLTWVSNGRNHDWHGHADFHGPLKVCNQTSFTTTGLNQRVGGMKRP